VKFVYRATALLEVLHLLCKYALINMQLNGIHCIDDDDDEDDENDSNNTNNNIWNLVCS